LRSNPETVKTVNTDNVNLYIDHVKVYIDGMRMGAAGRI
jgi:hypothetical protein